jgi:hypothetical protein
MRERPLACAVHHGVAEAVERITSKANLWADLGSRGRLASMLEQARGLGLRPRRVDVPAEWRVMLAAGAVGTEGDRDGPERAPLAHQPAPWVASSRVAAHEVRALKQAAGMTPTEWQSRREAFVNNALASGLRRQQTGVRWFVKFCVHAKGRAPMTELNQHSPWEEQLEATQLLMDFACWLAVSRPSGRPIAAKTIGKYLSHVRMWHRQEFFRMKRGPGRRTHHAAPTRPPVAHPCA